MGEQQQIEVIVPVVIQKIGLVAGMRVGKSVGAGALLKLRHTLGIVAHVDVKLIHPPIQRQVT